MAVISGGLAPAASVFCFPTTGTCCTHGWHLRTLASEPNDSSFPCPSRRLVLLLEFSLVGTSVEFS